MPSVRRCIFGCITDGITLHNFPNPARFPEQFQRWVDLVDELVLNLTPAQIYGRKKVCDLHFTADDRNRNNRLNAIAMPVPFPFQTGTKRRKRASSDTNYQRAGTKHEADEDSAIEMPPACADPEPIPTNEEQLVAEETDVPMPERKVYSWQQTSEVIGDQLDDVPETMSLHCDGDSAPILDQDEDKEYMLLHEGFRCNVCSGAISRFRYTCVQCSDFDLCGACEASRAHEQHYVLRVPAPRPAVEVQTVLDTIRRHLMKILGVPSQQSDEVASVKSETESVSGGEVEHSGDLEDEALSEDTSPVHEQSREHSPQIADEDEMEANKTEATIKPVADEIPLASDRIPLASDRIPLTSDRIQQASDRISVVPEKVLVPSDRIPLASIKIPAVGNKTTLANDRTALTSEKITESSDSIPVVSNRKLCIKDMKLVNVGEKMIRFVVQKPNIHSTDEPSTATPTQSTAKRRMLIKQGDLINDNNSTTVKKRNLQVIKDCQIRIPRLLTMNAGLAKPHTRFKVIKLPPGAKLKPIPGRSKPLSNVIRLSDANR